jgi:hypothetical protein
MPRHTDSSVLEHEAATTWLFIICMGMDNSRYYTFLLLSFILLQPYYSTVHSSSYYFN